MTTIINNYTPHSITVLGGLEDYVIASNGLVRLAVKTVSTGELGPIKLTKTVFGEPEGLPEFNEGIYYIVSQLVKSALPKRADLLVPAEVQRDSNGVIIGCLSLGI